MVARFAAPRLNLDFEVLEGIESATLAQTAGHVPGTPLPGETTGSQNALIAVARDTAASGVEGLRLGDHIEIKTPFGPRTYSVVERQVLSPKEIKAVRASRPRVTLVTPYPSDSLGPAPFASPSLPKRFRGVSFS